MSVVWYSVFNLLLAETPEHTSPSSPCDCSSFILQRVSSCSTLLWRRCRIPSCDCSSKYSSFWAFCVTRMWILLKKTVSPSLLKPSCTSHSPSGGSVGFPLLLLASQKVPRKTGIILSRKNYICIKKKRFALTVHLLYLRVPWCRGGLCGWAFSYGPLKAAEPFLMVLVESGGKE